ncbi:beta-amylase 8 [Mercurialis annua]|uniref:beta-amylase 8 n=1 Tax=Mercurialis annua TaxID=3986 RepID=UPI00215DDE36|nr:beta-amylase 8 [Mercurialis annua]
MNNQDLLINPQADHYPQPQPHPVQSSNSTLQSQPQPRRPRGFAATAAANTRETVNSSNNSAASGGSKGKREREKEKERTKLRERHRRAITSRMLAGLRQYGNFPLPARADMNDVLAALAREAGWTVEPDGTTYRQSPPNNNSNQLASLGVRSVESPVSTTSLKPCSAKSNTLECHNQASVLRIDESLSPPSLDSVVMTEGDASNDKFASLNSIDCLDADQLIQDVRSGGHEGDFTGTTYVPVYAMLATGFINNFCQLIDPQGIRQELSHMKSLDVDGVAVECWWGIVEAWNPQKYVWSGYRELFNIIREFKLKLQVVMAFHEYGASDSGEVLISLPQWVLEIGKENQDIFFTDREGRRNTECLSWGIDKERVLKGRTAIEVYFDFMRSFRMEFDDLFAEGIISAVEIGLGSSGELKYPCFPERMGWRYPGIGEFQCYDRYLQQSLHGAAKLRGHSFWARGPDNAGQYNSRPHETGFFCEKGDYDSYFGRFFLHWYAQTLTDHADNVLSLASLVFEDIKIIVKIPAVYWWYKTSSHAAELTAGYHNPTNQDGYAPVFEVLKKYSVTIKLACSGLQVSDHENDVLADSEGLSWQILNSAWDRELAVAGTNVLSCYDREGYLRVVEMAKPRSDPDHRQFAFFVYQQPSLLFQGTICFTELDYFIKCMHGDLRGDLVS